MSDTIAMIPADGWRAVYVREAPSTYSQEIDSLYCIPLVCFSLIEDLETCEVQMVGMVPDGVTIIPCPSPTFIGYVRGEARLDSMLDNLSAWKVAQAESAQQDAMLAEIRDERLKSTSDKPPLPPPFGPN